MLVDAFMTVTQANALADWVAAKGKNLTTIYITHRHGDHWFGVGTLLERFPNATPVATPDLRARIILDSGRGTVRHCRRRRRRGCEPSLAAPGSATGLTAPFRLALADRAVIRRTSGLGNPANRSAAAAPRARLALPIVDAERIAVASAALPPDCVRQHVSDRIHQLV